MLEQETEKLIETISLRTIGNGPSVAVKDILAADIPYPVKTFFRADVEMILMRELSFGQKNSRFYHHHPEVQNLQQQINSILILHYTFEREKFLLRLTDTVHMLVNYLVRPQWTLTNIIFEKETSIPTQTLIPMLRHFGPYEYLKDVILRYIQDKRISTMTRDECATLLWKIDGEYIRRKTGDELSRILSPLYEFICFPHHSGEQTISIKALIRFFEDKGATSVILRLEGEQAQSTHVLSRQSLAGILEDIRRTTGVIEVDQPESTNIPLNGELHGATSTDGPAVSSSAETAQHSVSPELLMEETERHRYIKRIFKQDEQAFSTALQSIGTMKSWKDASKFIDEIFIKNDIDPYSSDAERFIQLISQRYHHIS